MATLRSTPPLASARAAHALAGAAVTLGAQRLAMAAQRLEAAIKSGQGKAAGRLHGETLSIAVATLEALAPVARRSASATA
jgi:HPt (histidine-containing phosphotransfer) domain-containing protein